MEIKKYQRPQITVKCDNPDCGRIFAKDGSEVRRNIKRGSKNFCQTSCANKINKNGLNSGNVSNFNGKTKADKYTGIREHFRKIKYRSEEKNKTVKLTLDDLLDQWNKQMGVCIYTGVQMIHPSQNKNKNKSFIYMASLDRIDSNLGYEVNNIQFISVAANLAKNKMTHDEMINFCKIVSEKWK